jgi:hypothetical protein
MLGPFTALPSDLLVVQRLSLKPSGETTTANLSTY